jgi:UDP:flavonoid glycosyltransferase YjiC (YdhE family)
MKITFLALGSRGDILPCFYLAKALASEGHQIRFGTFQNFAPLITESGFEFHPVRGDIQRILNAPAGLSFIGSERNPFRMVLSLRKMFGALAETMAEDIFSPTLFDTDLLINQLPGGLYGFSLAEKLGIPHLLAAVMPLTPTAQEPQFVFPSGPSILPGYNAFTHWLAYQLVWQIFRRIINRWRVDVLDLQQAPLRGFIKQYKTIPTLNGFSAHVVPRPPDWGEHLHITGYWFPAEEEWQPPDDLREFIDAGPRPIFIGFGSMPVSDPIATTSVILEAVDRIGSRAILHAGWGGLGQRDLPSNIHLIEYAPYEWLFPQMGALVHHGGSGTTAFALRAGVPSLIVPFVFDQFYWGRRIHDLGVGTKPLPHKKLSTATLAAALDVALNDTQMQERATELGEKIQLEEGVRTAVNIIEGYLNKNEILKI